MRQFSVQLLQFFSWLFRSQIASTPTVKYVVPRLPCRLNCSKFESIYLLETNLSCCHHMSYFKAKLHQIRFRLGLH